MDNKEIEEIKESQQSLSELFKQVQDIKEGRAKAEKLEDNPMYNVKFNRITVIDKKFNILGTIIGVLFVIIFFSIATSSSTFANTSNEKVAIANFETNKNPIEMNDIINKNLSESATKEIVTEEVEQDFEIETTENDQLPDGEIAILQEGVKGLISRTTINSYENGIITESNVLKEEVINETVNQKQEEGTNKFLANIEAHVGDTVYTTDDIYMYSSADEIDEDKICKIYSTIDVNLISVSENWAKISVDGMEGYVKNSNLTSENKNPGIAEEARIKRIKIKLKEDMAINTPSGFTREDFIKVLSGNAGDKDKVIQNTADYFYEAEQNYGINGIFLVSIAIHESNWGTSNISKQKYNLFGYGSYDSSAFESSSSFENYQYGIDLVAKALVKYYINAPGTPIYDNETAVGTYYNGSTILAVNIRYASDSEWASKVYNIMKSLYEKL